MSDWQEGVYNVPLTDEQRRGLDAGPGARIPSPGVDPEREFETWTRGFALGVIAVCICLGLYSLADSIDWERIAIVRVTECGEVRR